MLPDAFSFLQDMFLIYRKMWKFYRLQRNQI